MMNDLFFCCPYLDECMASFVILRDGNIFYDFAHFFDDFSQYFQKYFFWEEEYLKNILTNKICKESVLRCIQVFLGLLW